MILSLIKYFIARRLTRLFFYFGRSTITRSLSDGNILGESDTTIRNLKDTDRQNSSEKPDKRFLSGSTPDIFTCGSDVCHCRYAKLALCMLN